MYYHYHLETCNEYFGICERNRESSTRYRQVLFRKATPYRNRKTSESCPGGLSSFQYNIRRLGPLPPAPSMPTIRTEEEESEEET